MTDFYSNKTITTKWQILAKDFVWKHLLQSCLSLKYFRLFKYHIGLILQCYRLWKKNSVLKNTTFSLKRYWASSQQELHEVPWEVQSSRPEAENSDALWQTENQPAEEQRCWKSSGVIMVDLKWCKSQQSALIQTKQHTIRRIMASKLQEAITSLSTWHWQGALGIVYLALCHLVWAEN